MKPETELAKLRRHAETSNTVAISLMIRLDNREFCGPLGRENGRTARTKLRRALSTEGRKLNAKQRHLPISERVLLFKDTPSFNSQTLV